MTDDLTTSMVVRVMRRPPVQRRGAATVSAILDACTTLLDQQDYDELTTAGIAELAGVPIGSFYQYFPDKRSVVHALVLRHLERFLGEVDRYFATGSVPADWRAAVTGVFGLYSRMREEVPGFGRVRLSDVIDSQRLDPELNHHALMARRLAELFTQRFPVHGGASPVLSFRMAVETADALLKLSERSAVEQRETVLATTHEVTMNILAQVFDRRD